MATPATSLPKIGMIIGGRPYFAEPADAGTRLYNVNGREAITSTGADQVINVTCTPVDTELADIAAAKARVRAAAAAPWTPRAERPSARAKACRQAAREYHTATWNAGFSEAQARFERLPLNQRITEADVAELVAIAMGAVLADPALRTEFVAAAEAAEFETLLADA
jgi:hypothetical protein